MEKNELMELRRRLTGVEMAVVKLQAVVGGLQNVLQMAISQDAECAECGNMISGMKSCNNNDCPCGLWEADDVSVDD